MEREAQTLIKGVGALLSDQTSLSKAWWCYAVESWIDTANCRPNNNEQIDNSASSTELITGMAPNLNEKFLFPFGCPVTFIKPKDKRDSHFETSSDYGIALGSSKGSNGATIVTIPGHGNKVYSRTDVQRITHLPNSKAPDPSRKPIIKDGNEGDIEITFQSPSDDLDDMDESTATTHGTMGFALFLNPSTLPTSSPIQQTHPAIPNLPGHIERERPRTRTKGIQAVKFVNAVKASPVALATKAMPRTDRNPTLAQAEKSST